MVLKLIILEQKFSPSKAIQLTSFWNAVPSGYTFLPAPCGFLELKGIFGVGSTAQVKQFFEDQESEIFTGAENT